jgi:outer membrane lipoprotein-sorting protein
MKFAFLCIACMAAAPAAAATLKDVERAFAATTSFAADFEQQAGNGAVARGTMVLKRPGRIRFDYGKGAQTLVVADGQQLSFIDYSVSQVSQWPLRSTALGVLLDPKADLARVAKVLPDDQSPLPGQVAVLAQDPKRPDIGRMLFFLAPDPAAPGGLRLTGWRVTDAQNNVTSVTLSNSRFNVPVAESSFRFRDPRPRSRPPGKTG